MVGCIGHNFRRTVRKTRPIRISQMMRVVISFTHVQTALNSVHRFMSCCIFAIVWPWWVGAGLWVLPTKKSTFRGEAAFSRTLGKREKGGGGGGKKGRRKRGGGREEEEDRIFYC